MLAPSRFEDFGLSGVEAAAAGVPVFAAERSGRVRPAGYRFYQVASSLARVSCSRWLENSAAGVACEPTWTAPAPNLLTDAAVHAMVTTSHMITIYG